MRTVNACTQRLLVFMRETTDCCQCPGSGSIQSRNRRRERNGLLLSVREEDCLPLIVDEFGKVDVTGLGSMFSPCHKLKLRAFTFKGDPESNVIPLATQDLWNARRSLVARLARHSGDEPEWAGWLVWSYKKRLSNGPPMARMCSWRSRLVAGRFHVA